MTTLAANKPRAYEGSGRAYNDLLMIASDIIYEGAAGGVVLGTGHVRPLVGGDRFIGFAEAKADNSSGAAAAIRCRFISKGLIQLAVTSVSITDIGQPVYATDDDTFALTPSGSFIGFVHHFVSSGVCVVDFDAPARRDPAGQTG